MVRRDTFLRIDAPVSPVPCSPMVTLVCCDTSDNNATAHEEAKDPRDSVEDVCGAYRYDVKLDTGRKAG